MVRPGQSSRQPSHSLHRAEPGRLPLFDEWPDSARNSLQPPRTNLSLRSHPRQRHIPLKSAQTGAQVITKFPGLL